MKALVPHSLESITMLLPLLTLLLAQFAEAPSVDGSFDGQCLYPEAVRERAAAGELVTCNQARIADGEIAFGLRSWQSQVTFAGAFEGDRLTVSSVTLANGRVEQARGVCQLYFANDKLSTIACTATSERQRSYAANFVASRINDPL